MMIMTEIRALMDRLESLLVRQKTLTEKQEPLVEDPNIMNQLDTDMDSAVEEGESEVDYYRRKIHDN